MPRLFLTIWAGEKKPQSKAKQKTKKPGTLHKTASAGAVADCTRSPVHGLGWGWGDDTAAATDAAMESAKSGERDMKIREG